MVGKSVLCLTLAMSTIVDLVDDAFRGYTDSILEETSRFLYVYNSTTLIAAVGTIAGLAIFGALIWIAVSSAVHTSSHYGGSYHRKKRSGGNAHY